MLESDNSISTSATLTQLAAGAIINRTSMPTFLKVFEQIHDSNAFKSMAEHSLSSIYDCLIMLCDRKILSPNDSQQILNVVNMLPDLIRVEALDDFYQFGCECIALQDSLSSLAKPFGEISYEVFAILWEEFDQRVKAINELKKIYEDIKKINPQAKSDISDQDYVLEEGRISIKKTSSKILIRELHKLLGSSKGLRSIQEVFAIFTIALSLGLLDVCALILHDYPGYTTMLLDIFTSTGSPDVKLVEFLWDRLAVEQKENVIAANGAFWQSACNGYLDSFKFFLNKIRVARFALEDASLNKGLASEIIEFIWPQVDDDTRSFLLTMIMVRNKEYLMRQEFYALMTFLSDKLSDEQKAKLIFDGNHSLIVAAAFSGDAALLEILWEFSTSDQRAAILHDHGNIIYRSVEVHGNADVSKFIFDRVSSEKREAMILSGRCMVFNRVASEEQIDVLNTIKSNIDADTWHDIWARDDYKFFWHLVKNGRSKSVIYYLEGLTRSEKEQVLSSVHRKDFWISLHEQKIKDLSSSYESYLKGVGTVVNIKNTGFLGTISDNKKLAAKKLAVLNYIWNNITPEQRMLLLSDNDNMPLLDWVVQSDYLEVLNFIATRSGKEQWEALARANEASSFSLAMRKESHQILKVYYDNSSPELWDFMVARSQIYSDQEDLGLAKKSLDRFLKSRLEECLATNLSNFRDNLKGNPSTIEQANTLTPEFLEILPRFQAFDQDKIAACLKFKRRALHILLSHTYMLKNEIQQSFSPLNFFKQKKIEGLDVLVNRIVDSPFKGLTALIDETTSQHPMLFAGFSSRIKQSLTNLIAEETSMGQNQASSSSRLGLG